MKLNNTYYLLRHGEALSNVRQVISSWPETFENPLTLHGKETIKESAKKLQNDKIDIIFSSDILRTKQTAQIVAEQLKLVPKFDKRLREIDFGVLNGQPIADLDIYFKNERERISESVSGGETYEQVLARVSEFLKDTEKEYSGKQILIVSHETPLWILEADIIGMPLQEAMERAPHGERIRNGQVKELH